MNSKIWIKMNKKTMMNMLHSLNGDGVKNRRMKNSQTTNNPTKRMKVLETLRNSHQFNHRKYKNPKRNQSNKTMRVLTDSKSLNQLKKRLNNGGMHGAKNRNLKMMNSTNLKRHHNSRNNNGMRLRIRKREKVKKMNLRSLRKHWKLNKRRKLKMTSLKILKIIQQQVRLLPLDKLLLNNLYPKNRRIQPKSTPFSTSIQHSPPSITPSSNMPIHPHLLQSLLISNRHRPFFPSPNSNLPSRHRTHPIQRPRTPSSIPRTDS